MTSLMTVTGWVPLIAFFHFCLVYMFISLLAAFVVNLLHVVSFELWICSFVNKNIKKKNPSSYRVALDFVAVVCKLQHASIRKWVIFCAHLFPSCCFCSWSTNGWSVTLATHAGEQLNILVKRFKWRLQLSNFSQAHCSLTFALWFIYFYFFCQNDKRRALHSECWRQAWEVNKQLLSKDSAVEEEWNYKPL